MGAFINMGNIHSNKNRGFANKINYMIKHRRLGELMVITGLITPEDLKSALKDQKKSKKRLGEVFLKNKKVTLSQLGILLTKQKALCLIAAFFVVFGSVAIFSDKKAHATMIKDVPAKMALTDAFNHGAMPAYPALFKTEEKRSENLKAFTKWTGMFDRFDRELKNAANNKIVQKWQKKLSRYEGLNLKTMAKRINDLVNKERYIVDAKNWGKSDYWATPIEFLSRGGDCEDFAIAKYTALRALGVPEERLRVAIVHDKEKNIPHAVLVVVLVVLIFF